MRVRTVVATPPGKPVRLLRVRVLTRGSVVVVVRRAKDCAVAGHLRVNLDRTRGLVRFRGRVGGHRLRRGVYVLTIARRAGAAPLRQIVVRITAKHRIVRLPRQPLLCLPVGGGSANGVDLLTVLALPTFGGPTAASLAGVPVPSAPASPAARASAKPDSRPVDAATAGATSVHLHVPPPIERVTGGGLMGTILAALIVASLVALPAAIILYVWRFLRAPAPK
jgi:hypothetical protein